MALVRNRLEGREYGDTQYPVLVEKLLKLDLGNMDLLAQRHRLLGQAVSETKEKLETLRTAAVSCATGADLETLRDTSYKGLWKVSFTLKEF